MRTVLDLFCGLGGFSAAFADSDEWEVVTVDIEGRFDPDIRADVLDLRPSDLPLADVVLASPPCDCFSLAQPHTENWDLGTHRPISEKARNRVALAYHALGLIRALAPRFWFLENPTGRLRWFFGEPAGRVTYCQYGERYQKPTDLWGEHPPMTYRSCAAGALCHERNTHGGTANTAAGLYPDSAAERAKVPRGLGEAILEAIEEAYRNPPPEQATLFEEAA